MSEREDRERYLGDVEYEVWRRGGNPDRVDRDRVDEYYYDWQAEDAAFHELRQQRTPPQAEEEGSGLE